MGRETKILLGLLGLLAGVFMGVLSMKLFVPRPPAGAGPDIHAELADSEPHDLVEPPRLTLRASDFAAAPPLVPATMPAEVDTVTSPPAPPTAGDRYATSTKNQDPSLPPRRDPFVAAASFEQPDNEEPTTASEIVLPPLGQVDEPLQSIPPPDRPLREPQPMPLAGGHIAQPGDTWWALAERAYGDGRLYRALYAWNRTHDPRITLAPGTSLQLPPLADLTAAWPSLMPPPEAAASDRRPL